MNEEATGAPRATFYEPKYKDGKIRAFADVDVAAGITVRGFRVVDGEAGLFAAVPSRPVTVEGHTRYMNQVVFADAGTKERFLEALVASYRDWEEERRAERASIPAEEPARANDSSAAASS